MRFISMRILRNPAIIPGKYRRFTQPRVYFHCRGPLFVPPFQTHAVSPFFLTGIDKCVYRALTPSIDPFNRNRCSVEINAIFSARSIILSRLVMQLFV